VTTIQLLCGSIGSQYDDSSDVCGKVLLQTGSKCCWRPSWQKMINPKQNLVTFN